MLRVISGQSIEVANIADAATPERVRLIGISAPDLKQEPWGLDAKTKLEQMIAGKPILLELDLEPKDRFEQTQAYVWQGGKLLNEQLTSEGYVLAVPRSPNSKYDLRLARAQEKARLLGVGIWNPDKPMRQTPNEFREQNR